MTKHPFYQPTKELFKGFFTGCLKVLMLFTFIIGTGFVCKLLVDFYPALAAFTHIHEYTNVLQASILCFMLLVTYLMAYGLPILIAIYFVWVFLREFKLMLRNNRENQSRPQPYSRQNNRS